MKLFRLSFLFLIGSAFPTQAQLRSSAPPPAAESATRPSNIIRSSMSDTAFFNIVLDNSYYDFSKHRLPYYQALKVTQKNQSALASLIVKGIRVVPENHAAVIRKYFSAYLSDRFEIYSSPGISKNENYNRCHIVPLRINALGQVEELVDYSINWQITTQETFGQQRSASSFTNNSVLATGTWYKIGVTRTGVYKLDKAFFTDLGINTANLDPKKIRVYGNGGKMIPERNKDFRRDDLQENAVFVSNDGDNNAFDNQDYVLFYATGTSDWTKTNSKTGLKYSATTSLYSDTSFYFVSVDLGYSKRMTSIANSALTPNISTNSFDYYNYHELNAVNFGKSGREFYGEYFDISNSYSFNWDDGNFVTGDTVISEVSLVSRYSDSVRFSVNCGSANYVISTRGLNVNDTHEDYAAPGSRVAKGIITDPSNITLTVTKTTPKSIGWLNKVTVNARRYLNLNGKQFAFRDTRVSGTGKVCKFSLSYPGNPNLIILNVSDPMNPQVQSYASTGSGAEFTATADTVNEYYAVPQTDFYVPANVGKVANQNLHSKSQADYVIITHPLFLKEAERIGAFHQQMDGFTYAVASIDQIYNEFGSGKQDPAAIRDFIRMLYSRNLSAGKEVKYVLLMGDGSYYNKSRSLINNSNLIPTYQSNETLSETMSVATDDFYAMMDDDEGYNAENYGGVDVGVGRFTCRTNSEVDAVINKVVNYYKRDTNFDINSSDNDITTQSVMGDWRNWLLFLADDEDNALHMRDSDRLTAIATTYAPYCNIDKIFLDSYQRYSTAGGLRYPDASADFLKRVKKGALIFNYTGHGGEVGLTAERMVDIDIINSLDNFNKLTLFVTATCEFSRYDDPARTSAGELCLLNPKGAAIALFTTCRLAFSTSNYSLNSALIQNIFTKLPNGKRPTLGAILQQTKSQTGQSLLANFHLLGDPALTLAYPQQKVVTTAINSKAVNSLSSDTLGALAKITISGYVADTMGNKLTGFNGLVYPTVFDKEQNVTCILNSEYSALNYPPSSDTIPLLPFQFKLQRNILYRGKIQVTRGDFSFSFLVPKDVSFAPGPGRISYYATNGQADANGSYSQLVVGGTSKNVVTDNQGPQINLFLNDKNFVSGSITNENPILFANLSDSSGINTVGTGIGHDISVILDQNTSKPVILNDYFEANLNSYQSGKVRYPFNQLNDGAHTLSFKAWDIQNNSSTANTDFVVAKSEGVALEHVLNYPNPFTTHTKFMFQHNQGCNPIKVVVQIYTVSGKIVKTLQKSVTCDENGSQSVDWDGKDDYGDKLGRGVYIYKLAILDSENKKAEKIEKLVILN